jgi:WD40 repeat protein
LLTLSGHTGLLYGVAFSPDGRRVATTSADRTAKVWDVSIGSTRSEQPLTLYNLHSFSVTGVSFSPDGKRLATSNTEGEARIYALPIEDIVAIAKSRVTRALTTDECRKYLHVEQCPSQP